MTDQSQNRDARGRLLPGHSSPGPGRPKGIVGLVREITGEGEGLIRFLWSVVEGTAAVPGSPTQGTVRDRIDAARVLLDRGWGKAPELSIQVQGGAVTDDLADSILEALARQVVAPRLATGTATVNLAPSPSAQNPEPIPTQPMDMGTVGSVSAGVGAGGQGSSGTAGAGDRGQGREGG